MTEAQVKVAKTRCDEAEVYGLKNMDSRIRGLKSEIGAESRRLGDSQKNLRKSLSNSTTPKLESMRSHLQILMIIYKLANSSNLVKMSLMPVSLTRTDQPSKT